MPPRLGKTQVSHAIYRKVFASGKDRRTGNIFAAVLPPKDAAVADVSTYSKYNWEGAAVSSQKPPISSKHQTHKTERRTDKTNETDEQHNNNGYNTRNTKHTHNRKYQPYRHVDGRTMTTRHSKDK